MAKKKETKTPSADQNRKFKIRPPLLRQLEVLEQRTTSDLTELINRAVRELLERESLWPPKNDTPEAS